MLMAIASKVMRQSVASIGTQKLNSCFSRQVGIWFDSCGEITFRCTRLWWLDFHMHSLVLAALASVHFGKGLVLMDITSSVMCLGVACIGMKSEKYVLYWWRFRRSAHEDKRNWKKDTQWAVADQPLVACNVMPIREMLLMMGVIILILFRLRTMQVCSRTRANVNVHGMCFHCSCSCRRSTFPPKEFFVQNIQSHSPFVPQFFLRCSFQPNDSVVWNTFSFSFS